ncbi:MAG: ion channel [Bacteroidia bacterium]
MQKFRLKNNSSQNDLGFGTRTGAGRNMNKDGSFNVVRKGEPGFRPYEIYHELITMSWLKFFILILSCYSFFNLIFAFLYYWTGVEHLTGIETNISEKAKFLEAFFFSSQTLTTVGYGRIAPLGSLTSSIAAVESMIGLLGFALATGLLYGRFSKPQAKILYSSNAIVAPYRDGKAIMFRLVNQRRNQLIEVEVELSLTYIHPETKTRTFHFLELERNRINLFPLSWTIVHPLDENSPLYEFTAEDLLDSKAELIVLLKAFDDTFSQTIYSRTSYKAEEVIFGAKFLPMFSQLPDGRTALDLNLINTMEKVDLPENKTLKAE